MCVGGGVWGPAKLRRYAMDMSAVVGSATFRCRANDDSSHRGER